MNLQVAHWKDHKPACLIKVAELEKKNAAAAGAKVSEADGGQKTPFITEVGKGEGDAVKVNKATEAKPEGQSKLEELD